MESNGDDFKRVRLTGLLDPARSNLHIYTIFISFNHVLRNQKFQILAKILLYKMFWLRDVVFAQGNVYFIIITASVYTHGLLNKYIL